MSYDTNNIFAKILRGEIPCNKVFENDHALAFRDINPAAPTHVLVIPKGPYVSAADFCEKASAEETLDLMRAISEVAKQEDVVMDGFRLISNHGTHGVQEVPHFHVHILGGRQLKGSMHTSH